MPVPGYPEIEYDYEELLGLEKMGQDNLPIGKQGKVFSVSRDFLDKISTKEQRQQMQNDPNSGIVVTIDNRGIYEELHHIKRTTAATHLNTRSILSNQQQQLQYLEELLLLSGENKADVEAIFNLINVINANTKELKQVDDVLEKHLTAIVEQLPTSSAIVEKWQETQSRMPPDIDSKLSLKLKLPFIFGEFEKEVSADVGQTLRYMREEFMAFWKGEKTLRQLFLEDGK